MGNDRAGSTDTIPFHEHPKQKRARVHEHPKQKPTRERAHSAPRALSILFRKARFSPTNQEYSLPFQNHLRKPDIGMHITTPPYGSVGMPCAFRGGECSTWHAHTGP